MRSIITTLRYKVREMKENTKSTSDLYLQSKILNKNENRNDDDERFK